MTRRSFFARLVGAAAAAVVAPTLSEASAALSDASAAATPVLRDPEPGIAIRFIRQYDIKADRWRNHWETQVLESTLCDDLRFREGDQW